MMGMHSLKGQAIAEVEKGDRGEEGNQEEGTIAQGYQNERSQQKAQFNTKSA
jgi:hypothetical protein